MSRTLRVGVDAHALGRNQTGNERFIANLLPHLAERCEVVAFVEREPDGDLGDGIEVRTIGTGRGLARQAWTLPRAVRDAKVDVLLAQYLVPRRIDRPSVAVVHDVSFLTHPEWFSPAERRWMHRMIPASMRRATRVVTVSEFSRREIIEHCGIEPTKVVVAHNGVDPRFSAADADAGRNVTPYILAVGDISTRKNLTTLVRAYALLVGRKPGLDLDLVIVGQDRYGAGMVHAAAAVLPTRIRFLGYVPDGRLVELVAAATALAYPSRYEGFGLPVIEAMAAGTPALAADIPVMREIAGDAAVLVPPGDVPAWADAIDRVTSDGDVRRMLTDAGRKRASRFTWSASADRIAQVLEEAAAPLSVR